jgi:deoxyribonuclease V
MASQDWRRFGAVDVHYPHAGGASAALVVAADARFATIIEEHVAELKDAESYQPGRFFARELPAIQAVVAETLDLDVLIVDGYVDLDPEGRPGLGAHVHAYLGMPVIGVAKTAFRTATHAVAVNRGTATRPLYVTATGLRLEQAVALVTCMAGQHRIPDALRRVDALARNPH